MPSELRITDADRARAKQFFVDFRALMLAGDEPIVDAFAADFAAVRAEGRAEIDAAMRDKRWQQFAWHLDYVRELSRYEVYEITPQIGGFSRWIIATGLTALEAVRAALETVKPKGETDV